jgi:hypothetical protein
MAFEVTHAGGRRSLMTRVHISQRGFEENARWAGYYEVISADGRSRRRSNPFSKGRTDGRTFHSRRGRGIHRCGVRAFGCTAWPVTRDVAVFETGVRYHMYHALALLLTATWPPADSRAVVAAGCSSSLSCCFREVLPGAHWNLLVRSLIMAWHFCRLGVLAVASLERRTSTVISDLN